MYVITFLFHLSVLSSEMTDTDWDVALTASKTRRNEFPLFECRTCKIMAMISEDDEDDLLITATALVDKYLADVPEDKGKLTVFQKNHLVTYLISRLGRLSH